MFQPGDLVLRRVFENTADPTAGKFPPNWEGPYIVTQPGESGSYAIDKTDGTLVPRMWNVMHLKRYYQQKNVFICYWHVFAYQYISKLQFRAAQFTDLPGPAQITYGWSNYKFGRRSSLTCLAQPSTDHI